MIAAALLRYLTARDLVKFGASGADAFIENLPDQPVAAVAAFTRPGGADTDGGHGYDEPGVQFLVRGDPTAPGGRYRSGYDRAKAIRRALHGLAGVTIAEGTADEVWLVQCLAVTSEPVNIGPDRDNRPRWSIEVRCEVYEPSPLRP